jgi:hypothetical protein
MAFDLTLDTAAQPNRRSVHSDGVGWREVGTVHPSSEGSNTNRSWIRKPPTRFQSYAGAGARRQVADPQVLPAGEHREGILMDRGRDDHLDEEIREGFRDAPVDDRVQSDHRAEGGDRVGGARPLERLQTGPAHRDAAGRGVLDYGAGRAIDPAVDRQGRRLDIQQVVERQLLPLELAEITNPPGLLGGVERRLLVRILPVPERHHPRQREVEPGRHVLVGRRLVGRDRGVVFGHVAEDLGGEAAAGRGRRSRSGASRHRS